MANFNTHITVAAVASGMMSVLCLQVGMVNTTQVTLLALAGTIGGILPDIDLQRSYPSRILFTLLASFLAFVAVFSMGSHFSVLELWLVGGITFFIVRYPIWRVFHKYTVHRGSTHSLLVALLATFITATFVHYWLDYSPFVAWLVAAFMLFGFLIHLILDEAYSVDFSNRRIKRSFGTAFKIWDARKPVETTALMALTIFIGYLSPSFQSFADTFSQYETYEIIFAHLFPSGIDHWFSLFSQ